MGVILCLYEGSVRGHWRVETSHSQDGNGLFPEACRNFQTLLLKECSFSNLENIK